MTTPSARGKVIHAAKGRMPATKSAESQFKYAVPSSAHHNPATAVNATMMYAPRASHDFHCGRNSTFKKRFGCDKSLISKMTVRSINIMDVRPAARKVNESKVNTRSAAPRLRSIKSPPAMFLVTRHDGNSQCHWIA